MDKENIDNSKGDDSGTPRSFADRARKGAPTVAAGLLLCLALALAYGPAKISGHSIYGGVIQDLTNLYGFHAWDMFSMSELDAGRFPLWNPHNAFGVPHIANMQSAVFYPLNWLKWKFGFWPVIDTLLMVRLWLAGMFAWLLARHALKASFMAAMIGAVAFMLSGHMTRYVYMSHLNVEILLPLQLLLMHLLAKRFSVLRTIAAGAGFALIVLGGFPEASLYAVIFPLAYYLFIASLSRRTLAIAITTLFIGLFISSIQWLPFAEYYSQAWTYHDPGSGLRHRDVRHIITLILPWFFGENRLSTVVPFLCPYLGVVPMLLAVYFLPRARRAQRDSVFFLVAAIALIGIIYGVPPFSWVSGIFPLSLTYNDKYAAPALALCVSMVAAAGADRLAQDKSWAGFGLASALILLWIAGNTILGYRDGFNPIWALGLLKPGIIVEAIVLVIIAAGMAFMHTRGGLTKGALITGLFAITLPGLLFDMQGHAPDYHDDLQERIEKLDNKLPDSAGVLRFHADPEIKDLFPDLLLTAGVDDVRSYEPLYPRRYVEYMAAANGISGEAILEHYNSNMIFAIGREHVGEALPGMANVVVYNLTTPMEERLLVREWAKHAHTRGPRQESWLRAEEVSSGGDKKLSLMDHAPIRIESTVEIDGASPNSPTILFEAGVPDNQVTGTGEGGDGVSMLMVGTDREHPSLYFARYLDPKKRIDDPGWHAFTVSPQKNTTGPMKIALALLPGPRDDVTRDAAAWGMLRTGGHDAKENLTRIGPGTGPPYFYNDDNAFPRIWMTQGVSPVPDGDSYMASIKKIAANNPLTFKSLALIRGEFKGVLPDGKAEVEKPSLDLTAYEPGKIEVESARNRPGFLVVADQYFPGWRAWAVSADERKEIGINLANGAFMSVPVPAGEWKVEFAYVPWAFRIGLWAALASLAVLLVPLIGAAARGQRQKQLP